MAEKCETNSMLLEDIISSKRKGYNLVSCWLYTFDIHSLFPADFCAYLSTFTLCVLVRVHWISKVSGVSSFKKKSNRF